MRKQLNIKNVNKYIITKWFNIKNINHYFNYFKSYLNIIPMCNPKKMHKVYFSNPVLDSQALRTAAIDRQCGVDEEYVIHTDEAVWIQDKKTTASLNWQR